MQLLTFTLGEVKYGIDLQAVQSIEQMMHIVSVPNTLPYIKGIMNLHGEVIPVYSLPIRFNYQDVKTENIVVVDVDGMKIGLEVCRVQEILTVSDDHIFSMPEIIKNSQECFSDVADNNKNLIVTLDVQKLLTSEEQQNIEEMLANQDAV